MSLSEDQRNHLHQSFVCSIMDLADDIAFGVHDLEDSLALRLIGEVEFRRCVPEERCGSFLSYLNERYPDESQSNIYERMVESLLGGGHVRKRIISRMVHYLVTHCRIYTLEE